MQHFGYIVTDWLKAVAASSVAFVRRSNAKILWVFSSVAGLVVLSASLAAVGRATAEGEVQSSATQVQEIDAATPSTASDASGRSRTVITQTQQTTASGARAPQTDLRVNGAPIPLPKQGTVHKEIHDSSGKTTIDVSIDTESTSSSSSESSSSITLQTTTESTKSTDADTDP